MSTQQDDKTGGKESPMRLSKRRNKVINQSWYGVNFYYFRTLFAPLDRVKIVLQGQPRHPDLPTKEPYRGLFRTCSRLVKEQPGGRVRPLVLWRGNLASMVRGIPHGFNESIMILTQHYFSKKVKESRRRSLSPIENLICYFVSGALAGTISLCYCHPFDLVRTRITVDVAHGRTYKPFPQGVLSCFSSILKKDGFRGLYRGFLPASLGVIPYRACYFMFYAFGKGLLLSKKPGFFPLWTVSMCSTTLAMYLVYPFDTVRRRMMMSGMKHQRVYKNSVGCLKRVLGEEGVLALYAGAGTNLLRATGSAFLLAFFDMIIPDDDKKEEEE